AVVVIVILVFCGGYLAGFLRPDAINRLVSWKTKVRHERSEPWRTKISDYGTESCVRLIDADGDGLDDVIVGLALGKGVSSMVTKATMGEFCRNNGMEEPCAGMIIALRGYDGEELWRRNVYSEIFALNCHGVDVDKDGRYECIATGRLGTIIAVDVRTGNILWEGSDNNYRRDWNIYSSATVQDMDFDGVREIIISHGGDPTVPAEIHKRKSNRIVMVSGATGVPIGRPLITPEDKETYMSPVIHERRDGSQYVLIGSGGETVGGLFLVISLPDFYRYALGYDKNYAVSNVKGNYDKFGFKAADENGLIELYRSEIKGVMVPPVLADVNKDGVRDILMSCFDGTMILFDGETLNILWKVEFGVMESYSSPSPGHFNEDDILDFMVHWSVGSWPTYNATNTIVLDGRDGTVLWNLTSNRYDVTSDLTIQSEAGDFDLFLFRVQGRNGRDPFPVGAIHGATGVQRIITKRSTDDTNHELDDETVIVPESYFRSARAISRKKFKECEMDHRVFLTEMFALGRHTMRAAPKLWEKSAEKYFYRLSESDRKLAAKVKAQYSGNKTMKQADMPWKGKRSVDGPLCVISEPDERTTGAIGDVDGDGKLDAIVNMVSVGVIRDEETNYVKMKFDVDIYKVNIEEILPDAPKINLNVTIHPRMLTKEYHAPAKWNFRSGSRQTWAGYMGTYGDSVYS
ncbi:hypothetical protein FSP39_004814, partial [Pinctada imbricata]